MRQRTCERHDRDSFKQLVKVLVLALLEAHLPDLQRLVQVGCCGYAQEIPFRVIQLPIPGHRLCLYG